MSEKFKIAIVPNEHTRPLWKKLKTVSWQHGVLPSTLEIRRMANELKEEMDNINWAFVLEQFFRPVKRE